MRNDSCSYKPQQNAEFLLYVIRSITLWIKYFENMQRIYTEIDHTKTNFLSNALKGRSR